MKFCNPPEIGDRSMPERNLLAACLERAIRDYLNDSNTDITQTAARESFNYIFGPQDKDLFSFDSICFHLNIDPNRLREFLKTSKAIPGYRFSY